MPIEVTPSVIRWLRELKLTTGQQSLTNGNYELSYNDQIYFENGYLIAQLLRAVLRKSGHKGQGLLRIRKIAHISSNENWRILIDILKEIGFDAQIDPHNVLTQHIQDILEFLCQQFARSSPPPKKLKKTHVDLNYFNSNRPLQQAQNLLQFLVLALKESFQMEVGECVGMLIENGKYLKQTLYFGTNQGFKPVIKLYQVLLKVIPTFNKLLSQEYGGEERILWLLGFGVLSESQEVCKLCCILLDSIDTEWPQTKGVDVLIRSPHSEALDLLFRRVGPKISNILNTELTQRFQGKLAVQLRTYNNLLKYFSHSLFGKQAITILPISYYISTVFEMFEPDQKNKHTIQQRVLARQLLAVAIKYFEKILGENEHNKVLYCFDQVLAQSQEERFTLLCLGFELVSDLLQKQKEFGFKLFYVIWKYFTKGTFNLRSFFIDNLLFMFKTKSSSFPISLFLSLYQPSQILQANEFQLLRGISAIKELSAKNSESLLKIATIYYYQQLCAGGMIEVIKNLIKNQSQLQWAYQISQQILSKWPTLQIPPYQAVPVQSKSIKYRSVGLKKKEMIQFTQLNRYKNMLLALVTLSDKVFLTSFAKSITQTISKVQKSKAKQMQNTRHWLQKLLFLIDDRLIQIKEPLRNVPSANSQTQTQTIISELTIQDSINYDIPATKQLQSRMQIQESENEFMKQANNLYTFSGQQNGYQDASPLLPFTEEQLQPYAIISEELYFQNYEHIYVRNINQRYQTLLKMLVNKYKTALNLQHFFETIGIKSYVQHQIPQLTELQKTLDLSQDQTFKKVSKIVVQSAFYAFQFKSNRRVSINCVQSFLKFIADKNPLKQEISQKQQKIQSKMQFEFQLTSLVRKNNSTALSYLECFQVLSQIVCKSLGVGLVEPISKMVTRIGGVAQMNQSSLQQQRITQDQLKELQNLEKIIQNESMKLRKTVTKIKTASFKKKQKPVFEAQVNKSRQATQRWAQVQKRVIMRRRELQGKAQVGKQ